MAGAFLRGYLQQQQADNQQGAAELQSVTGLMSLIKARQDQVRAEQEQQADTAIKSILAAEAPPEQKIQSLLKVGPKGIQAAQMVFQTNAAQRKEAEEKKKSAFYSPENRQQFIEQTYTPPATPNDDEGNINPSVQGAPRFNFDRFIESGASQGIIDPEKYVDHLARRDLARSSALAAQQARRDAAEDRDLTRAQQLQIAKIGDQTRRDLASAVSANRPQGQVIQTENGPMMVPRGSVSAVPITGPDGLPIKAKGTERAMPASAAGKLLENNQNLRKAEQALALIKGEVPEGDKAATGWKGFLPDFVLQRLDQEGISTRAAIGDLGSMVIHDRSGAAVTAAEFPRLRPFIPLVTDDPATVEKKLDRFVKEYRAVVDEAAEFYRSSGYRVPSDALGRSSADAGQKGVNPVIEVKY